MRTILTVPLMLLYLGAVMVTSGHLHSGLKYHPTCTLCALSKTMATADSPEPVMPLGHTMTAPERTFGEKVVISYRNIIVVHCLARAPPPWEYAG